MAARTRKIRHDENTRAKIQTSQLVNRLTQHVLGRVKMTPTQVRAAEILLDRSLPKLTAIELGGIDGAPIMVGDATVSDLELARRCTALFEAALKDSAARSLMAPGGST